MPNLAEQTVRSTFPGVGLVPLISGAHFMGIAEKTARNWLVQKKFPIQTVVVGDKRFIPIPALISWYSEVIGCNAVSAAAPAPAAQAEPEPVKRGRGRPRKIAGGKGDAA